jgi:DNA polymerase III epsilon subunit-like protein
MQFIKDILLVDFEGRYDPTQVGAILLDKETLVEKDSFSTYIFADLGGRIGSKSGITQEMLAGAPSQAEVGKKIVDKFGMNYLIGSWVADLDTRHFKKIMKEAGYEWGQFDYHVFDIWSAAYLYLIKNGYTGSISSEDIFREFGAKLRGLHDALEDCRIAADVLRKIVR